MAAAVIRPILSLSRTAMRVLLGTAPRGLHRLPEGGCITGQLRAQPREKIAILLIGRRSKPTRTCSADHAEQVAELTADNRLRRDAFAVSNHWSDHLAAGS